MRDVRGAYVSHLWREIFFRPELPTVRYHVIADYVPRGANVMMGSDPQCIQAYYNDQGKGAWTAAYAAAGSQVLPPTAEFDLRLIDSPVKIAVTGLLTQQQAQDTASAHADLFWSWVSSAQPVAARLRGSFNLRDDKLRQFYYRGQAAKQVAAVWDKTWARQLPPSILDQRRKPMLEVEVEVVVKNHY
jgi:hypothetical protein